MAKASKPKKTVKATTKPVMQMMTKPNKVMKDMMKSGMPGKMMN